MAKNRNQAIDYRAPGTLDAPPISPWRMRGTFLVVSAISCFAFLTLFASESLITVLHLLLTDGALLLVWLVAMFGWGMLVPFPRDDKNDALLRAVTAIGLGIGIISLVTLGLGLAGRLNSIVASLLMLVGVGLTASRIAPHWKNRRLLRDWFAAPVTWQWLWLIVTPIAAMAIVAAFIPPGLLWGDEPHGYDVLEYHLQLPREWYELGKIAPLKHNVFSFFPLGVEMHYLLAMHLRRGPWEGMYLAQLMHLAMCGLSVAAMYAFVRESASKLLATSAAIAIAATPWLMLLGSVAYNEGGILLFGTLAVGWALRAMISGRGWLVAGLCAGFACGTKLTGVPMLLIGVPVAALISMTNSRRWMWRGIAAFVIAGAFAFAPWLSRNYFWAQNPVFPEAQSVLGRGHFSEVQSERWRRAHSPTLEQTSLGSRLYAAKSQILRDVRFGFMLLPAAIVAFILSARRPESILLLVLLLLLLIFWLCFTHLQGRFFVLAIPIAAMLVAQVRGRWPVTIIASLLLVHILLSLSVILPAFQFRVVPMRDAGVVGFKNFNQLLTPDVETALAKNDARYVLIGDARAFLYQLPMSRLGYKTVFDVDTSDGKSINNAWVAGEPDGATLIVDPLELDRFSRTYFGIPPLGPEMPGPRDQVFVLTPVR